MDETGSTYCHRFTYQRPIYYQANPVLVLLFSIFTLGIYTYWWHYQNWRLVKQNTGEDISPGLRAIFYQFFAYSLFDRIADTAKTLDIRGAVLLRLLGLANLLSVILGGDLAIKYLPLSVSITSIIILLDIVYVQFKINQIHRRIVTTNSPSNTEATNALQPRVPIKASAFTKTPLIKARTQKQAWSYSQRRFVELGLIVATLGLVASMAMEILPQYVITAKLLEPLYLAKDLETQMTIDAAFTGQWPDKEQLNFKLDNYSNSVSELDITDDGNIKLHLVGKNSELDGQQFGVNLYTVASGNGFNFYTWQCGDAAAPLPYYAKSTVSTSLSRLHTHTVCRN